MIRSLSKHSNYLFVFNNFYSRRKLDYLFVCLKIYYKYLALPKNVLVLVRDVRQLFYSLYDEYVKFYYLSLNLILNKMMFLQLKLQIVELVKVINCYFK